MSPIPIEKRWLLAATLLLACSYLLPNHSPPWVSFHQEAWCAVALALLAGWIFAFPVGAPVGLRTSTLVIALLSTVPLLQYALGLNPIFGTAWVQALYLLGLLLSLRLGETWESGQPGQCLDYVFLAMSVAAVVSVALQIYQWFDLETDSIWAPMRTDGRRMFANIAQPNQLASLQVLGLIGLAWGLQRKRLVGWFGGAVAMVLLVGIALAESRTAWVNLVLLYLGILWWRKQLPHRHFLAASSVLLLFFAAFTVLLPWINQVLGLSANHAAVAQYRSMNDPIRLKIWTEALSASTLHPWLGYGWGRVAAANFAVANDFAGTLRYFSSSHNLVMDLILWNGYPVGLLLAGGLALWCWRCLHRLADFSEALMFAFLVVLLVHAMLELPLQYAYFLLPLGVVAGALQQRQQVPVRMPLSPWWDRLLWVCAMWALSLTVMDYFKIETNYLGLRLENAKIHTDIPREPPKVRVLDQFERYLALARDTPVPGRSATEIAAMEDVVNTLPSARAIQHLAQNYALNGQAQKAQYWLSVLCKSTLEPNCTEVRADWLQDPRLQSVPWPQIP